MWVNSCGTSHPPDWLFQLTWWFWCTSMLLQTQDSFVLLKSTPLCICAIFSLSVHHLMNVKEVSGFVLLWIVQRLTWKYIFFTYWFHLDIYPMGRCCLIIWGFLFLILCFDIIVLWFEGCVNVNICFNSKLGKQWI